MPFELLRQLVTETLPSTLHEEPDIDRAHVLFASDLIACTFSAPGSAQPFARVLAITKEGHTALAIDELRRRRGGLSAD